MFVAIGWGSACGSTFRCTPATRAAVVWYAAAKSNISAEVACARPTSNSGNAIDFESILCCCLRSRCDKLCLTSQLRAAWGEAFDVHLDVTGSAMRQTVNGNSS